MNEKSNGKSRLAQSDRTINRHLVAINRTPVQGDQPASPLLGNLASLASILAVLIVNGCSGIPSKLYTTKDPATRSAVDPTPCDTFTYGEHPIVVVEGFADVSEATLEILTNGNVVSRQTIPMNSGQVDKSYIASTTTYSGLAGQYVRHDQVNVVVNAGAKIDLGAIAPGTYDLTLKTNDVVAAVARFKVNLPAMLETERQEIESERLKLQQVADQLNQLNAEIDRDRNTVDRSNPTMLIAFNAKVAHYNQLVQQAKADQYQFNIKVQNFNARLKYPQFQLPRF
jgi:hypothetical protein